jgi:hypothetical protein
MIQPKPFLFVCDHCGRRVQLKNPQRMIACGCGAMQSRDAATSLQPFTPNKLGIAYTSVQRVGGAETFLRTMLQGLGPAMSGAAVMSPTIYSNGLRHGLDAMEDLAKASENLIVWGFVDGLPALVADNPQTNIYAIHHGSLASTWANEMFAAQIKITGRGVAVNQEVAATFGVDWLPNPVLKPTFARIANTTEKPRVLWNHRWSEEKRPELAIAIAKELKDAVEFAISAPPSLELPANCHNIGQTTGNVNWLAGADVFLSTATQEAFGYSLAEAAYVGIPIVSTPYGIGSEVAARVVDCDDPREWANAILAAVGADTTQAAAWIEKNHGRAAIERWAAFVGADLALLAKPKNYLQKIDSGPGTELQKILKLLGINPKISCGCESLKNKMNRWGVEGCQEAANFEWIISQMVANAAEYSWYEKVQAAMAAAVSTIAIRINPLDVYGSLIREAIRRSEAASVATPETP